MQAALRLLRMRRLCSALLAFGGFLAGAAPVQAARTDEQLLARYLHAAESYFPAAPNCTSRTVHLHADAAIDAAHHHDQAVEGMAFLGGQLGYTGPCDVWLRSGLTAHNFYVDVFHEMAHTAGYVDGLEMDAAVQPRARSL